MINRLLNERKLPQLKGREDMLEILQREEYGYLPPEPENLTWVREENYVDNFCAGKASITKVSLTVTVNNGNWTFPVYEVIPTERGPHPFFIHINFRDDVPDRYMPTEELVDNGFAVLSFNYEDVTMDDGDFTNGLAGLFYPDGRRSKDGAGKIALWAWAAHRVMDYAETVDALNKDCACVCGHSRLGKTALFTAATDERFQFAYSNDSGCSGAAISRGKGGESVEAICNEFPFWFCENYNQYKDSVSEMPFDQHYLLAAIAPRFVCIGSASEDLWADPTSEFLSCAVADAAFTRAGVPGFVYDEDRLPEIGELFFEGNIGYHLRKGLHYFSREDWNKLIRFIRMHK